MDGRRTMMPASELSRFLEGVERRAFRYAMVAVYNEDVALDLIQDTMLKLSEKYGDKPSEELPLLFYRILQNSITDWRRRQKIKNLWTVPYSALFGAHDQDQEHDPLELVNVAAPGQNEPAASLAEQQSFELIETGLARLPTRQREAFLLRYWEEHDVANTAKIMGCSEGSVKTHCSRASASLAAWLNQHGFIKESVYG